MTELGEDILSGEGGLPLSIGEESELVAGLVELVVLILPILVVLDRLCLCHGVLLFPCLTSGLLTDELEELTLL